MATRRDRSELVEQERLRVISYCKQLEIKLRREGSLHVSEGSEYFPAVENWFRRLPDVKIKSNGGGDLVVWL